jgi:hypothetical protein
LETERIKGKVRRYSLFALLAVTRALYRADYHLPIRYYSVIDSVRASSGILHEKISFIDKDVEEDFREKEKAIDRHLGREKFYDDSDIEDLRDKQDQLNV